MTTERYNAKLLSNKHRQAIVFFADRIQQQQHRKTKNHPVTSNPSTRNKERKASQITIKFFGKADGSSRSERIQFNTTSINSIKLAEGRTIHNTVLFNRTRFHTIR
mmetsp:Transcript_18638/g.42574  ORF Transcript_18638/g.42574 Transcript_18638/m.42574 type:complete len:106 (+) Transcript_18638:31-348(+)